MEALFWRAAGPLAGDDGPPAVLLAGMMVCAADGMLVNVADTPANRAMFGCSGTAAQDGAGAAPFPQLRIVAPGTRTARKEEPPRHPGPRTVEPRAAPAATRGPQPYQHITTEAMKTDSTAAKRHEDRNNPAQRKHLKSLVLTYNQLDGWASKFLEAGVGAFIGSLWAVSDEKACGFAEEFYSLLRDAVIPGLRTGLRPQALHQSPISHY
jgi:hypothetical protein